MIRAFDTVYIPWTNHYCNSQYLMSNLITHTITYTIQLSETERTYALYLSTQTLSTFTPQPSVLKPFSRLQPSVLKTRTPITRQYLNPKYLDPLLIIIISFFLLTSLNELPCIQNLPWFRLFGRGEIFTHMETSPLPGKGSKLWPIFGTYSYDHLAVRVL